MSGSFLDLVAERLASDPLLRLDVQAGEAPLEAVALRVPLAKVPGTNPVGRARRVLQGAAEDFSRRLGRLVYVGDDGLVQRATVLSAERAGRPSLATLLTGEATVRALQPGKVVWVAPVGVDVATFERPVQVSEFLDGEDLLAATAQVHVRVWGPELEEADDLRLLGRFALRVVFDVPPTLRLPAAARAAEVYCGPLPNGGPGQGGPSWSPVSIS